MKSKYDNGERHLEEINHVSILESVDEVFDGATSLMTLNAIMYGSTVTALIAGLPIRGDLDIAVSKQEYMKLCQNFASSVKWLQVNGKRIPERSPGSSKRHTFDLPSHSNPETKNPYAEAKHLPVSKTAVFQSLNDSRVQIVESKIMTGDKLEDALEIVRKVDFTFCGIAVDNFGRMLEAIPHAYEDCLQRVIRIQNYQPAMDPKRLEKRLRKYIERGWSLTISIDQIMINLNKAKAEYAKALGKKSKSKKPRKAICLFNVKQDKERGSGHILETKKSVREAMRMSGPIRDTVRHISIGTYDLNVDSTINGAGYLVFWGVNKQMTMSIARHIASLATDKLMLKYRIDPEAIRKEDKQRNMAKVYGGKVVAKKVKMAGYASGGMATYGSTYSSSTSTSNW